MAETLKVKRGVDIKLKGVAERIKDSFVSDTCAIKPPDFHGVIPKMVVKAGAEVKAGEVLFYDKDHPEVKFVSPVSGEVTEIVRGAKRRIMEVRILVDKEQSFAESGPIDITKLKRNELKEVFLEKGLWPFLRQRPYDIVANPNKPPRDIFISAFDSSPLSPDFDFLIEGEEENFQKGLDALGMLTDGKVYLTTSGRNNPSKVFTGAKNVVKSSIVGPHPAGNVGVQIHQIKPINKGEAVWTVNPLDVCLMGKLFNTGRFDSSRVIALAGSEVSKPRYMKTFIGANVAKAIEGELVQRNVRVISGNPLTGTQIGQDGHLGFYDHSVSVLPEGDYYSFFGWLTPNLDKFSLSRSFFSWLQPSKKYELDTNMNGERRAFVVTGQYEKTFPFDIFPVQLIKAILVKDIDKMEQLGIYEIAPEDFALPEYSCTSKMPLQEMVREGLDLMIKEVG